ncbi:MAG: glycosyltransferase family 2 protein [Bacteroidales bacterium]|nr:glycosyltransferase family 2 protein [Bacteroidales bacterium]
MTPKVSIIIPLYNAGKQLNACINSIINQTFTDFEVIVIVDCPTDGSDIMIQTLTKHDSRFHIYHNTTNQHIGLSRNNGIDKANGTYLLFVDHDDILAEDCLEQLVTSIEQSQADIVITLPHTTLFNDETNITSFPQIAKDDKEYIISDLLSNGSFNGRNNSIFNLVIGNLYRTELVKKHNLRFVDTNTITPEDHLFQLNALLYCHKVNLIDKQTYTHMNHDNNEGGKDTYIDIEKRIRGLEIAKSYLQHHQVFIKHEKAYKQGAAQQLVLLTAYALTKGPKFFRHTRKTIKLYTQHNNILSYTPPSTKSIMHQMFRRFIVLLVK